MQVYLTKTRWKLMRAMRVDGRTHPRPLTLDIAQRYASLTQGDAQHALNGMVAHGLLVRVGDEYRPTRKGVEVLTATDTGTINDVTFDLPEETP